MPDYLAHKEKLSDAEILGIYGQNGSGKTAVIDAMRFLSDALADAPLKKEAADYITAGEDEAELVFAFSVEHGEEISYVEYAFSIRRGGSDAEFGYEKLYYGDFVYGRAKNRRLVLACDAADDALLRPKTRAKRMCASKDDELALAVAKLMAKKERRSFLFSDDAMPIISKGLDGSDTIFALSDFARRSLFVIKTTQNENFILPVDVTTESLDGKEGARLLVEPALVDSTGLDTFTKTLAHLNLVLDTLIPGLSIDVELYGEQMMRCGLRGTKIELVSVREGRRIPIKYESEGIRKIISVLNIMIAMYNDRSVCMVVDELDAGIYEYLLGELLTILDESGAGQLIFTSHNLRPLEMIDRSSIIFTTTNPENRYIRLGGKKDANLRDLYLRTISLGGEKEEIYDLKNSFEICHAMRQAGMKK